MNSKLSTAWNEYWQNTHPKNVRETSLPCSWWLVVMFPSDSPEDVVNEHRSKGLEEENTHIQVRLMGYRQKRASIETDLPLTIDHTIRRTWGWAADAHHNLTEPPLRRTMRAPNITWSRSQMVFSGMKMARAAKKDAWSWTLETSCRMLERFSHSCFIGRCVRWVIREGFCICCCSAALMDSNCIKWNRRRSHCETSDMYPI